jgi:hypothetical protein
MHNSSGARSLRLALASAARAVRRLRGDEREENIANSVCLFHKRGIVPVQVSMLINSSRSQGVFYLSFVDWAENVIPLSLFLSTFVG